MDKDFPATLREYDGYNAYMCGRQQHQGFAAFSKLPVTDVLTAIPNYPESMCRYMELTVADMRFINIYAPQGQQLNTTHYAEKVIFNQKLIERVQALISNNILPIIAGDFNILPTSLDLFNFFGSDTWRTNCMCLPAERSWFNRLLQLGYIQVVILTFAHYFPDIKCPCTWWNTENDFINRRGFRPDYFLIPHIYLPYMKQPTVLSDLRLA
jgi:exodeoxyribonuclease-3